MVEIDDQRLILPAVGREEREKAREYCQIRTRGSERGGGGEGERGREGKGEEGKNMGQGVKTHHWNSPGCGVRGGACEQVCHHQLHCFVSEVIGQQVGRHPSLAQTSPTPKRRKLLVQARDQ